MSVKFSPWGNSQFVDSTGAPASGWKIYTYVAGSSTLATTYTTSAGNVAQSNPIVLNSLGLPTAGQIWLTEGVSYKLVLTNAADVVQKTEDNISGVNDTSVAQDQWVAGPAPTYISATSFSLVGDQTDTFQVGRRVKTTNSGGTVYSSIKTSTFGAVTTVTVVNDSSTLDSGLSAVSYGILSSLNPSAPQVNTVKPAFLAFLSADAANATGDGTGYSVICDSEVFDQNMNYNNSNGVFTAPVTGKYLFNFGVALASIGAGHTLGSFTLITSNRSVTVYTGSPAAMASSSALLQLSGSVLIDMDAADTAQISIAVSNSTKTVTVDGDASAVKTYFSGQLVA